MEHLEFLRQVVGQTFLSVSRLYNYLLGFELLQSGQSDRQECLSYFERMISRLTALDQGQSCGLVTRPAATGLFSM
jgi:hypothetical protein